MRSSRWAKAVAMGLGLAGLLACGGAQPRVYRVAVDTDPLNALPGSCYPDGIVPEEGGSMSGAVLTAQWMVWDGPDDTKVLEPGEFYVGLGGAGGVGFGDLGIEGRKDDDATVFACEQTQTYNGVTRSQKATITFTQLGDTAQGTLDLHATCTGEGGGFGQPCVSSCSVNLPFTGRRLDVDASTLYVLGN